MNFVDDARLETQVQEQRRVETDLAQAETLERLGTWRLFPDRTSMHWSEDLYAMLGLSLSEPALVETMLSVIHADDRRNVELLLRGDSCRRSPEPVDFRVMLGTRPVRHCRLEARPLFFGKGSPIFVGICQDITRHKESAQALLRTERLKTLGQLIGGIVHDLNNILLVTMLNLEQTAIELPADHPTQEWLAAATLASTRGAELTSRLLSYSRRTGLEPRRIDLHQTFAELATLLNRIVGEQFVLTWDPGPPSDRLSVHADPCQLETALMNLVINARDAMPEGGRIAITAACRDIPAREGAGDGALQPGCYAVIEVADQGVGIPAALLGRVFEPFFTTKAPGSGCGLGLSMVDRFARQSGGLVGITSTPGHGTTVSLYLPVEAQDGLDHERPAGAPAWTAEGLRVLVVEDEPAVLHAVTRMMSDFGFEVTQAASATVALAKLAAGDVFDLLFSDFVLPPPMSGAHLATVARGYAPNLKVLLTSGYLDDHLISLGHAECDAILAKPYGRETLRGVLGHVFAEGS
jgi:signal transduction histidine kinase/CheY-like chemotaxis protein